MSSFQPGSDCMRTIVHLSDLHFGRIDTALVIPLLELIGQLRPDLVAVSGDLTQRARTAEFLEARRFLDQIAAPKIVVPGNHDVPLYNLLARFGLRLRKYQRYIGEDLLPFFSDAEIAVAGINTARAFTHKGGRVNRRELAVVVNRFAALDAGIVRIVVTHHPFDVPPGGSSRDIVGRARFAMTTLAACGADLFLSGHLHRSHIGQSAERYRIAGHSALLVHAGTISTRLRHETNALNIIRIDRPHISVQCIEWAPQARQFGERRIDRFVRLPDGWVPEHG